MSVLLMTEQKELLIKLVEAVNNSTQRKQFHLVQLLNGTSTINHPGLPNGSIEFYKGDIEILSRERLILISQDFFDVTPMGFEYCKELKELSGQPVLTKKDIKEKREQRDLYLKRLFEKGCTELQPCTILAIGKEFGWDDSTTDEIETFLENERLIAFPNGGQVFITHEGKKYVEQMLSPSEKKVRPQEVRLNLPVNHQTQYKLLPILLFVLGLIIEFLLQVTASILPKATQPYLWLSWPLLGILILICIWLMLRK